MDLLKEIFAILAYTVFTGCGVVIVKKLVDFLNSKIDEAQENTDLSEYAKLNGYIDDAQNIIASVVESVAQTFVDELKESGKFDNKSAKTAKDMAVATAKVLITSEGVKAVETLRGDFDVFLDTEIEKAVSQLNN